MKITSLLKKIIEKNPKEKPKGKYNRSSMTGRPGGEWMCEKDDEEEKSQEE